PRERASFSSAPWPADRIVDAGAVADAIRDGSAPVLDARASDRYQGVQEPLDPVAGHVPGAVSAPWDANLGPDGRLLPRETLAARYRDLGVVGDRAIAYCGSGVTACLDLFAMDRAGFGPGRLYDGSWSDWIRDAARPVATGPERGRLD
ncbi:MAG TPA: rhodanese-like domain-containing protein, partial [Actinomycetota bacterium]